ncbi:MAG: acyltransferase [Methylophilus methylotrophus]|uniref:Acyltransferase n=1 Tax=Methylophilus methylotrophus TaxID=17 RepID=A0A5C7WM62_METME|nr:MAG: acyltransferase [Methylophilus methylotrophus]
MNKSAIGIRANSSIDYVGGLDGLRAIAVLLVMLRHYTSPFNQVFAHETLAWRIYQQIANLGWLGVDIFFVISGFLITKILMKHPVNTWFSYRQFIIRRVKRLIPAYVTCLLIFTSIAMLFAPGSKVLGNSLSLWTMTSNIQSAFVDRTALMDAYFNLVHFWSLAVEWHFYLILPLFVWRFKSMTVTAVLIILFSFISRVFLHSLNASDNAFYSFTFCRLDALAFGCLLAVVHQRVNETQSKMISLLGLLVFFCLVFQVSHSPVPYKKLPWMQLYGYTLIGLSIAMILIGIVNASIRNPILRILELKPMTKVGRASYSLYIWHLVFFPLIANLAVMFFNFSKAAFICAFVTATLLASVCAFLSFKYLECRFYPARPSKLKFGT